MFRTGLDEALKRTADTKKSSRPKNANLQKVFFYFVDEESVHKKKKKDYPQNELDWSQGEAKE